MSHFVRLLGTCSKPGIHRHDCTGNPHCDAITVSAPDSSGVCHSQESSGPRTAFWASEVEIQLYLDPRYSPPPSAACGSRGAPRPCRVHVRKRWNGLVFARTVVFSAAEGVEVLPRMCQSLQPKLLAPERYPQSIIFVCAFRGATTLPISVCAESGGGVHLQPVAV